MTNLMYSTLKEISYYYVDDMDQLMWCYGQVVKNYTAHVLPTLDIHQWLRTYWWRLEHWAKIVVGCYFFL